MQFKIGFVVLLILFSCADQNIQGNNSETETTLNGEETTPQEEVSNNNEADLTPDCEHPAFRNLFVGQISYDEANIVMNRDERNEYVFEDYGYWCKERNYPECQIGETYDSIDYDDQQKIKILIGWTELGIFERLKYYCLFYSGTLISIEIDFPDEGDYLFWENLKQNISNTYGEIKQDQNLTYYWCGESLNESYITFNYNSLIYRCPILLDELNNYTSSLREKRQQDINNRIQESLDLDM